MQAIRAASNRIGKSYMVCPGMSVRGGATFQDIVSQLHRVSNLIVLPGACDDATHATLISSLCEKKKIEERAVIGGRN
jgi:hypothetical protein